MTRLLSTACITLAVTALSSAAAQTPRSARVEVRHPSGADAEARRAPTIPRGIDIPVTLDQDIPVERDRLGDTFEGHIARDVRVNGEVLLVSGAPVEVKLVQSEDRAEAATVRLTKVHVNGDMKKVAAEVARADTEERGLSTAEKTAVGAGAGAVVGAVVGAGVLEGAVVGAGGGLAWGLLDGDGGKVDDDTTLRFSLEQDLKVD